MISLQYHWQIIEGKVNDTRNRGEEILSIVSHWQEEVEVMKNDVQQLRDLSTTKPNLKGRYHLSKQAEEKIEAIKKLTDKASNFPENIAHPKPPPPELEFPSNENYVDFNSRQRVFKEIVDALKDPTVKMIGVHGAGGTGKTTLVDKVREHLKNDGTFEKVPMAVVSKDLNVKDIQSTLASSLNIQLDDATDQQKSRGQLRNIFMNGEKYLVILDDIWQEVDLREIGIPITVDGKVGCKVVLTSRDEDLLLNRMGVDQRFSLAVLQEEEARALFKKVVGNSLESQPELRLLAREVCQECKGLPIAITALGKAMKGKPEHAWKDTLDRLQKYRITEIGFLEGELDVFGSLRVSYDMLRSLDEKSCFLLCCLYPEDAEIEIDDLTRHCVARGSLLQNPRTLDDARNVVLTVVDNLKSASLLSHGRDDNVVRIHDVIRDVGIAIAREDKGFLVDHNALECPWNPTDGSSYTAISLRLGNIKGLPNDLVYPQLHTLMLDGSRAAELKVPDRFFSGMEQLTVLVLSQIHMRRLPSSLAELVNLRMLYLIDCELEDISILVDLKTKLEVLSLRGSSITVLPSKIGQLTSLRLLDLRDCDVLGVFPHNVISNWTNLEELYFPGTSYNRYTMEKLNPSSIISLDELSSLLSSGRLTTLHIHIPEITLLPEEGLKFDTLKRFMISVGSKFGKILNYSGTCMLKLDGVSLEKEFLPLVEKADVLYLSCVEGLKKVFNAGGGGNAFFSLKYLQVESCDDLEYLIPPSRSFSKLTQLIIDNCKFKYLFLPSDATRLLQLERLDVQQCELIEAIIGFEGEEGEDELTNIISFSKLKHLELQNLPNLKSFYPKMERTETTGGTSSSIHEQSLFNEKDSSEEKKGQ